jgi:uncharacterized protein with PQ loop repeat
LLAVRSLVLGTVIGGVTASRSYCQCISWWREKNTTVESFGSKILSIASHASKFIFVIFINLSYQHSPTCIRPEREREREIIKKKVKEE